MNKTKLKGISLGSLKSWKSVLREWQALMEDSNWWKYSKDAPWWYNERASLSLFAGALWRCHEWAFEEYRVSKQIAVKKRTQKKAGRGDINFGIKGEEFVAEAKQCYPVIQKTPHKAVEDTIKHLKVACQESYRQPSYGARRVGLVFVVPRIRVSRKERLVEILNEFIQKLRKNLKNVTIVWAFPTDKLYSLKWRDYFYPGIILIAKSSKKKTSRKPYYGKLHKAKP